MSGMIHKVKSTVFRMRTDKDIIQLYKVLEHELTELIGPVRFSSEINLRLERISHLLELLNNPHNSYASIHVGGTSGKGSTATMIANIFREAGYKTGLHISPHLQIFNERHQINNKVTSSSRLVELFSEIKPAIRRVSVENPFGTPSYFEAQVALALYLFQQESVDVAVVEVGLGGTLDATNVLNATVSVLTNVGLDHTEILGETVEMIISDKAGIIKPGQTVISGVKQREAQDIISQRCQNQKADLWQIGKDFHYEILNNGNFTLFMPSEILANLEVGMKGDFQIANAACATAAVKAFHGFNISQEAIRIGLQTTRLPGRMEIIQQKPVVVLDGAHNPEKMKASSKTIDEYYGNKRRIVVFSLKSGKAASDILPYVLERAEMLILTTFRVKGLWEPMQPESLAELVKQSAPSLDIRVVPDPINAIEQALTEVRSKDLVWVTGSLYLVGDVREFWYPSTDLIIRTEKGLSGSLIF